MDDGVIRVTAANGLFKKRWVRRESGHRKRGNVAWGYSTPLTLAPGASTSFRQFVSTVAGSIGVNASTTKTLTEYICNPLNYYFLTSRKAALDAAPGWQRTGLSFTALADADPGTRGVTRYYFD